MSASHSMLLALCLSTGASLWGTHTERAIPEQDLLLQIRVETREVEFGQAFALTVVRVWNKDLRPEPFDDQALAPLVLRQVDSKRREDDLRIEETRHFRAYLFATGKVLVPAAALRARPRDGGLVREVFAEALEFEVRTGLDPADVGPVEELDPLPAPSDSCYAWPAAALALLAGLTLLLWNFRNRGGIPVPSSAAAQTRVDPHQRASQRLLALREQQPKSFDENRAYYVEASDLLRSYIEDRFALRATRMTTDEFLAAERIRQALPGESRALLADFLELCDLAKFAGQRPETARRGQLLDAAEGLLSATHEDARAR